MAHRDVHPPAAPRDPMRRDPPVRVALVLYPGMTALDVVGPHELLRFVPGVETVVVSPDGGMVPTDTGVLELGPSVPASSVTAADVVVVPGGPGTAEALAGPLVPWLREVHATTRWTTSVCSGSLLLAAAGLLRGRRATSHFSTVDALAGFGAVPVRERVVIDEEARVITAAGVSAGLDMALHLVELLSDRGTAEAVQLVTEYAPRPHLDSGTLEGAAAMTVTRAVELGAPQGAVFSGFRPPV